ncbi:MULTISPECIES: cupin [Lelliottia]|uniref:Cupin n=1 Tax=Lelliottia aquatilis TaxID=2080838 RepID=A0ABX5A5P5_9ENTR|nr:MULTISPECIES: cupin [Lelliottia]NTZ44976.1 cupin [Lelliottia aquatilis]POZ28810.1 cupin [Lelliottia aquatilis]POZ33536.1 cupin [Lelliottia aquatilis]POZ34070.1 cupin [Lelliottia sp. 7254-16]POZ34604.1 cupin [Lelliottia aquatilis]
MKVQSITPAQAKTRVITPDDMVSCNLAFIDCKLPGSHLKQNYSFIGPGVTQSSAQVVNIPEPHGFNIGAAAMPKGVTNNLHLHFTAEVFLIHEGTWRFRWGANGENEAEFSAPAILSIPTWIFRGFTNVSKEETCGMVYTVLGGNNTGGIIWHPSILAAASEYGLYLSKDNMLLDVNAGDTLPDASQLLAPLPPEEIAALRHYSVAEMRQRAVTGDERRWSADGLLDSVLPGHGGEIAPVIGYGISQDRHAAPAIVNPHGFSVEWLRLAPEHVVGRHLCPDVQVIMVFKGALEVTWNQAGEEVSVIAPERSVISVPGNSWRKYRAVDGDVECILTTQGDQRKRVYWDEEILAKARELNRCLDPDGYVAAADLLPVTARKAGLKREVMPG